VECSSTELGYRQNTSYRAKNVVNVLKLVTKDTIEEIIHLQGKKAKLAEDIIEGKETAEHYLIREEIIDLLSEKYK
jgi:SNF2 family DNA or RNA helicase